MSVTHSKVSGQPNTDPGKVGGADWDAAHVVSLAAADIPVRTVRIAAGVPAGAPADNELPIAFDSTATTGGLYVWNGSAWVLAAPIPPVLTPD